jgi:hypothetical protein
MKANNEKVRRVLELIDSGYFSVRDGAIYGKNGKEKTARCTKGYKKLSFTEKGKKSEVLQHRVLFAYYHGIEALSDDLTINHKDGDKDNNSIENLEQVSVQENTKHAHSNKLLKNGRLSKTAKLTTEDVTMIKALLREGGKHRDIAKLYGVSKSTITNISTGVVWKDIEPYVGDFK